MLGPSDKPVTQLVRLAEGMNPLTAPAVAHVLTGGSGVVHEMLEDDGLLGDELTGELREDAPPPGARLVRVC